LVSACDSIFPNKVIGKIIQTHNRKKPKAVVAIMKSTPENISKSSAVVLSRQKKVSRIIEKPKMGEIETEYLGLPLYTFSKTILPYLGLLRPSARGEKEIQDLVNVIIKKYGKIPYIIVNHRHTITTLEDLKKLNLKFLRKRSVYLKKGWMRVKSTHIIEPVYISGPIQIGTRCVLGPYVFIEEGAILGNNVKIKNSCILRTAYIPDDTIIGDGIIL
jgi:NDP-sugar pyrophosphorylase family protein